MVTLSSPHCGKEKRMPAFLHKMVIKAPRSLQSTMKPNHITKPSSSSLEENQENGNSKSSSDPNIIAPPLPSIPASNYKITYSLTSGAHIDNSIASSRTSSRSRSRKSPISQGSSSFMSSSTTQFTSLWDESPHLVFPPIHPSDYLKTLLSQLAASVSAMKTAYAHQQAALNPYNMQGVRRGREGVEGADVVWAADQAMVEELERLSQIHLQLSLLPHMQQDEGECKSTTCSEGAGVDEEEKKKEMRDSMLVKRYEGIITRFYDEMGRKDAVAVALKETLAKSMLQGEKLERRVRALEAALTQVHTRI